MRKNLSDERMFELEVWLATNYPENTEEKDKIEIMNNFAMYYSGIELTYIIDSYEMPFHEIKRAIIRYDSSHPKMDELVFINDLKEEFCMPSSDILRRIRQVRRLLTYLAKNLGLEMPNVDINQFVDDEDWEVLIKQDREGTKKVQNALNFEDRKTALVEKLEVLRYMAEYNGLSLDDLVDEANKRKSETSGIKLNKVRKE